MAPSSGGVLTAVRVAHLLTWLLCVPQASAPLGRSHILSLAPSSAVFAAAQGPTWHGVVGARHTALLPNGTAVALGATWQPPALRLDLGQRPSWPQAYGAWVVPWGAVAVGHVARTAPPWAIGGARRRQISTQRLPEVHQGAALWLRLPGVPMSVLVRSAAGLDVRGRGVVEGGVVVRGHLGTAAQGWLMGQGHQVLRQPRIGPTGARGARAAWPRPRERHAWSVAAGGDRSTASGRLRLFAGARGGEQRGGLQWARPGWRAAVGYSRRRGAQTLRLGQAASVLGAVAGVSGVVARGRDHGGHRGLAMFVSATPLQGAVRVRGELALRQRAQGPMAARAWLFVGAPLPRGPWRFPLGGSAAVGWLWPERSLAARGALRLTWGPVGLQLRVRLRGTCQKPAPGAAGWGRPAVFAAAEGFYAF